MVWEFSRRVMNHLDRPTPRGLFDTLALMQHHGAVTRLVDFTHSFFVAAFFALEASSGTSSVWMFNRVKLELRVWHLLFGEPTEEAPCIFGVDSPADKLRRLRNKASSDIKSGKSSHPMVVPIETDSMPGRLDVQQGLFMAPMNLSKSFMENLASTLLGNPDRLFSPQQVLHSADSQGTTPPIKAISECIAIRLDLPGSVRDVALSELREMNVHSASLFPGLDGFARSLNHFASSPPASPERMHRLFRVAFSSLDQDPSSQDH